MKKTYRKFLALTICLSALLTSCFSPVFYNARNDVPPAPATILGTIRAITRYTVNSNEYLVIVADKGLLYKDATKNEHGNWKVYNKLPFDKKDIHHYDYYGESNHIGQQMLSTYADKDTLYLFTVEYVNDEAEGTAVPSKFHLYAKKITTQTGNTEWSEEGEWTTIINDDSGVYFPTYKHSDYYYSAFSIISTNAVQTNHRNVYIRRGNAYAVEDDYKETTYFQLEGLNQPVPVTISPVDETEKNNITSAVYFNNDIMFFNSIAATTNETKNDDATVVYYGKDKSVYYKKIDDAEFTQSNFRTGQYVSTLCTCKDSLIIGRANYNTTSSSAIGGLVRTTLNSEGIPAKNLVPFETNADVQLSTTHFILCMINTTPDQNEKDSSIYASIDFLGTGTSATSKIKAVGLWSYYSDRGNWNRE